MKFHLPQLRANFQSARLAVVEGVVVEEDFLQAREVLQRELHFIGDVGGRPQSPAVSGMRLRPQTKRAHGRAAARGVEGNIRIQQKRDIVFAEIQVALVDLGHPRKLVQILDGWALGIVDVDSVLAVTDARKLAQRRALGVVGDLVIELAPHDEVDGLGGVQHLVRLDRHRRPHEAHLHLGIGVLHHVRDLHVHVKAGRGSEQHQQLEVLGLRDRFLNADAVRRSVQHLAVLQHSRRVAQPHRIPVRLDFPRGGPARSRAAIEALKRRRI